MTAERFSKAATTWDKKPRRVELAEKISTAISQLPLHKDMQAMEFGCGTGLVSLALAPKLRSLTAIDRAEGMLEVLQKKIDTQQLTNMQCCNADIFADDFSKRYDLIFCSMTLHHLPDAEKALQRFATLLNPGGYLAVADLVSEDGSFHDPSVEDVYYNGFDTEALKTILAPHEMVELHSSIAHTIHKETNGRDYPVFLLTGRKKIQ